MSDDLARPAAHVLQHTLQQLAVALEPRRLVRASQLGLDLLELALEPLRLAPQRLLERAAPLALRALAFALGEPRSDREQQALVGFIGEAILALRRRARRRRAPGLVQRQLGPRLGERPQRGDHASLRVEQIQIAALRKDLEHQLEAGVAGLERDSPAGDPRRAGGCRAMRAEASNARRRCAKAGGAGSDSRPLSSSAA